MSSTLTDVSLCIAGAYEKHVSEASPHLNDRAKMDAEKKKQASSSSCLSVKSDSSKEEPPDFSNEKRCV